jgi:oligopeptide transport system substrate-binding protein
LKRQVLIKLLLCFGFIFLLSCSKKTEKITSELIVGQETEPERLSPITIKDPQTYKIAWQIYEGLLGLDENGQIVPKIAENWETEDNIIWTFHIRKDVKFHTSEIFDTPGKTRTVTAHDILYSYTRFCSSDAYPSFILTDSIKGASEYNAKKTSSVEGLKVIDDYTFQIELIKPEPFFINRITTPWIAIFPKEAEHEQFKNKWGFEIAIGTGPYKLVSKTDNEIVMVKNENYWDKANMPKIYRLVFRVIKNDQIRFAGLTKNDIDLMVLPNKLFSAVFDSYGNVTERYKNDFNFNPISTFNIHMIGINLKQVTNVHLRRAMFYGTNRKEMIINTLYGYGEVIGGAVPPGMNNYIPLFENIYNPEKAREELKLSHYDGKEFELLIHDLVNSEQIGQIYQKQMSDIGINIKLTKLDFSSVIDRVIKGNTKLFSMFFEFVFSSPEPLLLNLFSTSKIPVPNFWQYSNQNVDKRLEELRYLNNRQESVNICADIEKEIMQDVPAIFLYRQKYVVMFSKKFNNLRINEHNHYMFEKIEMSE